MITKAPEYWALQALDGLKYASLKDEVEGSLLAHVARYVAAAVAEEREACARLVEDSPAVIGESGDGSIGDDAWATLRAAAIAIRARGAK